MAGKYTKATTSIDNNRSQGSLILQVNRLSGRFPSTSDIVGIGELNSLRGNLFGCGNIPEEDEYSGQYTCGSEDLDISLYVCVAVAILTLMLVSLLYFAGDRQYFAPSSCPQQLFNLLKRSTKYINLIEVGYSEMSQSINERSFSKIQLFGCEMNWIHKLFRGLVVLLLLTSIPLYGLKISEYGADETAYTTHSYQYRWVLTATYLRGELPLVLLLIMWFTVALSLSALTMRSSSIRSCLSIPSFDEDISAEGDMREDHHDMYLKIVSKCKIVAIFLLNISVVGSMCGMYIFFSTKTVPPSTILGLQIAMAIFNCTWNIAIVPVLAKPMIGLESVVWTKLWLLIFNNIFIPSIVTVLTSPSCFQVLVNVSL